MPYSPHFIALSTLVTILIILISIGVLLYNEKHYRYDTENVEMCVDPPEKTAAKAKGASRPASK